MCSGVRRAVGTAPEGLESYKQYHVDLISSLFFFGHVSPVALEGFLGDVERHGSCSMCPLARSGRDSVLSPAVTDRQQPITDPLAVASFHDAGDSGKLQGVVIGPDQPLFDAGFDSLMAEELIGRLQERLVSGGWGSEDVVAGVVNTTMIFDCPTARLTAEYLEGVLMSAAPGGSGDPAERFVALSRYVGWNGRPEGVKAALNGARERRFFRLIFAFLQDFVRRNPRSRLWIHETESPSSWSGGKFVPLGPSDSKL